MEEFTRKCFVCSMDTVNYWRNIYTLQTKHSSTPIYKLLEKITGMEFLELELEDSSNTVICHQCFLKLNEYEVAVNTVQKLESEFISLLNRSSNEAEIIVEMIKDKDGNPCLPDNLFLPERSVNSSSELTKKRGRPRKLRKHDEVPVAKEEIEDQRIVFQEAIKLEETFTPLKDTGEMCSPIVQTVPKTIRESRRIRELRKVEVQFKNLQDPEEEKISHEKPKKPLRKPLSPIKCSKCSKEFLARSEYKLHLKIHEDDHKVICYICGSTYKSKSALVIHMGIHDGVSPFECSICQKKFTQKGALVRHMPIHTGEKPYQCDKCGKQFIHYSSFHMHQLSHDDIRTKKCPICGLQLRSNSHLNRHMRVHSGEKPHACPICGQKFAQRYNMTSHYKTHMGIHRKYTKTYSCKECSAAFRYKKKLCEHMFESHRSQENPVSHVSVITDSSIKVESIY